MTINNNMRMNDKITAKKVLLVGPNGTQAGVVDTKLALQLAAQEGLDLVEVNSASNPPVAKLMDYGKMQYQLKKNKRKAQHAADAASEVKGMQLGVNTEEHDMLVKLKKVEQFLNAGNKVRITVRMKGRERSHPENAIITIKKFLDKIESGTFNENSIKKTDSNVSIVVIPDKK